MLFIFDKCVPFNHCIGMYAKRFLVKINVISRIFLYQIKPPPLYSTFHFHRQKVLRCTNFTGQLNVPSLRTNGIASSMHTRATDTESQYQMTSFQIPPTVDPEPIIKSEPLRDTSTSMALQPLSGLATVMTKQNEKRIILISLHKRREDSKPPQVGTAFVVGKNKQFVGITFV